MYDSLGLSRSDISSCEYTVAIPNTNTVVVVATLHRHLHHHILSPFRALLAHTHPRTNTSAWPPPRALRRPFSGYLVSRPSWTGTNCSCCCCRRCSRCSPSCCRCCRRCCIAPPSSTSSRLAFLVLLDSSLGSALRNFATRSEEISRSNDPTIHLDALGRNQKLSPLLF